MASTRPTHRETYSQQFSHPKRMLHRHENLFLQPKPPSIYRVKQLHISHSPGNGMDDGIESWNGME
jgi:hypothetical protein